MCVIKTRKKLHQNVGSSYLSVVLLMYFILFIYLLQRFLEFLIFFQKENIILIVTRLTSKFIHVSFPTMLPSFLIIIHITHYVFTLNSKIIFWSKQDWGEVLFPIRHLPPWVSCCIMKNSASPFLRDWFLPQLRFLRKGECVCVCVCVCV